MYSLRDDTDNDAWADYRTPGTRYAGTCSTQQNARGSLHGGSFHQPVATAEGEQEEQTQSKDLFSAFYNRLLETSTHVDVQDLCDTAPAWDKLPECPVCASGRKLDVLHLARSCLCSPYPCEGHMCACSERNVTSACLSSYFLTTAAWCNHTTPSSVTMHVFLFGLLNEQSRLGYIHAAATVLPTLCGHTQQNTFDAPTGSAPNALFATHPFVLKTLSSSTSHHRFALRTNLHDNT